MSRDRYTVISADGHAGASVPTYREYLASRWYDEFDVWAQSFQNPFADLAGSNAYRNWDSEQRLTELEADGIVAEVLFPNTVPPFFPSGALVTPAPNRDEYEHRWAGLQAHNRWLADFCAAAPGRRAGVAQILLNDLDDTLAEVEFVAAVRTLRRGAAPGSATQPRDPAAVVRRVRTALGPLRGARPRREPSQRGRAPEVSTSPIPRRAR